MEELPLGSLYATLLVLILLFYLVLGCLMDSLSMILLTVPIFFPVISVMDFGMSAEHVAIWFGILVLIVVEVGLITPPVGINVYVVFGVAKAVLEEEIPLETIFKGIFPFVMAVVVGIVILVFCPWIILFLPHLMY